MIPTPATATRKPEATRLSQRAVLVELAVVRAMTGLRPDQIYARVDGASRSHGPLLWVFDLAASHGGKKRNLRFWLAELEAPESVSHKPVEEVIASILPPGKKHFPGGEVLQRFALSRPGLLDLRAELRGDLRGPRESVYPRSELAAFLHRRWLGHASTRTE